MERVLECLPLGSRVAILRLRSLGDSVLTTPALDILKRFRPDLRLAVMVEDRFRAVFEGNPDLDAILPPVSSPLRRWRPELCLNLHGGNQSAWMTVLSGARYRAGYGHFRYRFLYNVRIPRAQEILGVDRPVHTAEHLASAMFYLGVPVSEIPRARLSTSADETACATTTTITTTDSVLSMVGQAVSPAFHVVSERPLAVIHPFAATPEKTWSAKGFLSVANHLRQSGIEPAFIGGPIDDLAPFRAFRTISNPPLSETKQLLSTASLFIGNDSGPAHMAAAFGLPAIVIFGASDPAIWGPWRTTSEVISAPGGINEVQVSQVLNALTRLRVHA